MKLTVEGTPKEIVDFALAIQNPPVPLKISVKEPDGEEVVKDFQKAIDDMLVKGQKSSG